MPTYEYKCEKCGDFELWQSIKDDALAACPTCGAKVHRLISANVGFVFKGGGFYQNEYKDGGSANPKTKPAAAPAAPEIKNEVKPAAPPVSGTSPSPDPGAASAGTPGQGCDACGSPDPHGPGNN